ncbi:MAG: leucine-rich repeat domain-containing protein, partial [Spirochaetales bacterium]|nr:leucine-rich repeat domain-containing protein [Spirochaetales bacterium]
SGTVTREAEHASEGVITYTCIVCGATRFESIPELDTPHTYSDKWSWDTQYHWHASTCGHENETKDKAEHEMINDVCSVCGYDYADMWIVSDQGRIRPKDSSLLTGMVAIPSIVNGIVVKGLYGTFFVAEKYLRLGFAFCDGMTGVIIPDTIINVHGFYYCKNLVDVVFPDSMKKIEVYSFINCSSIIEISFPSSLRELREGAFYGCTGLTRVSLPASLSLIEPRVFSLCKNLTDIDVAPENQCFSSDGGMLFNKDRTYLYLFPSASGSIKLPDGLIMINAYAFESCNTLESIIIPGSVSDIGYAAFIDCSSLTEITFTGTKEQWNTMTRHDIWNRSVPATSVHCSDGDVAIKN